MSHFEDALVSSGALGSYLPEWPIWDTLPLSRFAQTPSGGCHSWGFPQRQRLRWRDWWSGPLRSSCPHLLVRSGDTEALFKGTTQCAARPWENGLGSGRCPPFECSFSQSRINPKQLKTDHNVVLGLDNLLSTSYCLPQKHLWKLLDTQNHTESVSHRLGANIGGRNDWK